MRYLVFSDLHGGSVTALLKYLKGCDGAVFLGDGEGALPVIRQNVKTLYAVCGNCDTGSSLPEEEVLTLGGKRILICHGHRYRVKYGTDMLLYSALEKECDAVLFGHTHILQLCTQNGVYLFNPGASGGYGGTVGFMDIDRGQIMFTAVRLSDGKILL